MIEKSKNKKKMKNKKYRNVKIFSSDIIPTNKTQVFNEISLMENWLIIHVINSRLLLVLYTLYI